MQPRGGASMGGWLLPGAPGMALPAGGLALLLRQLVGGHRPQLQFAMMPPAGSPPIANVPRFLPPAPSAPQPVPLFSDPHPIPDPCSQCPTASAPHPCPLGPFPDSVQ
ncbi:hypothetical protein KIL84_017578 [Mauremys mutica]|uniref:Uncharacterized protein n=1 Tax=Mauremys mutica TaxID=74926 RepID=A0A9D3X1D3_9SAUR|nr:hypothetical protein KIL84_017578 [Mauremys mutica]